MKNFTFSTQKCIFIVNLLNFKLIALVVVVVGMSGGVFAQPTTVNWRSDGSNGNWEHGTSCDGGSDGNWNYPTWTGNRRRPDCYGSHIININGNGWTSMTLNSSSNFNVNRIFFGSASTNARTIGADAGRTLILNANSGDPKIENNSSATHTFSVPITLNNWAEINPVDGDLTFSGNINMNGQNINVWGNNSKLLTFSGILSGTSSKLILNQNSKILLTGANTYTGNTEISAGELWIGSGGDISSSSIIFLGNGGALTTVTKIFLSKSDGGTNFTRTININNGNTSTRFLGGLNSSGTNTFSGPIYIANSQPLTLEATTSGGITDFTGQIRLSSGATGTSANVTVTGSGSIQMSAAHCYTGTTTINSGATLRLGVSSTASATGPLGAAATGTTVSSGGVLDLNGFSLTSVASEPLTINGTGISSSGALINSSAGTSSLIGTIALGTDASIGGSGNISLSSSAVISGANSLTKVGAGILTLRATNTFGGAGKSFTIQQGTVDITSFTSNLGDASNTITLGGSSTSGGIDFSTSTASLNRTFTVASGGGTLRNIGSGTPTFSHNSGANTITLNGNLTLNCSSSGNMQFNCNISGTGGIIVNSSSTGEILMQPASAGSSTYTGDTKITSGRLNLSGANLISNSSDLVMDGGTFGTSASGAGFSETMDMLHLTASSTIALGTGSHTLTFSASNAATWTPSAILTITGWTGTAGATGSAGKIFVGVGGLDATQLEAITFNGYIAGATLLPSGEIVPNNIVTITSTTTGGNWNATGTWVGGVVPAISDNVRIQQGATVTVTADASCRQLEMVYLASGTSSYTANLAVNSGITLSVTNSVFVTTGDNQNKTANISGAGTLSCGSISLGTNITPTFDKTNTLNSTISNWTCSGSLSIYGNDNTSSEHRATFNLQSGTLTVAGISQTVEGDSDATFTTASAPQSGTLNLTGATPFTLTGSPTTTLNGTTATVSYQRAGDQTVLATTYRNLTIANSTGVKTSGGAFTVQGTLTLNSDATFAAGHAISTSSAASINGTFRINSGGSISAAPNYGASSTLVYNSGGTYGRGIEWSNTSGAGYPSNVTINSGSGLDLGNGGIGTLRQISGNLVINGGLYMDFGSNDMTQSLNVLGDLSIASTGQLSLSESVGGDIYVSGNWTRASGGIFNPNGRAVFFTGNANTTINGSGGETFAYLIHQKTGGTLQLASNVTITAPANSNALTHSSSVDFNLNGNTINLTNASTSNLLANGGVRNFTGTGTINIGGGIKTITSSNSGTLSFGSNITIALTGGANFGSSLTTINGTLKIDANGYVSANPPIYGNGSTLHYNTGSIYSRFSEWSNNSSSGSGVPHHVLIGSSSSLIFGANSNTASNITSYMNGDLINNGTFFHSNGTTDALGTLSVAGNVTSAGTIQIGSGTFDCNGTFNATSGNVTFSGNGTLELSGSVTSFGTFDRGSGTPTIRYNGGNQTVLALNASSSASYPNLEIAGTGTKTLAGTSSVYGNLVLTSGSFDLNAKTIYPKVHITRTSGDIIASSFSDITIDNSGSHNLCGVNSTNITIKTTSNGGTVTTTGDITCRSIDLTSGSKIFTIDGETVNVGTDIVVTSGTLNITSGTVNINSNSNTSCVVNGGILVIDGGIFTIGNNTLADLSFSSGTIDLSGGTLNIVDQFEMTGGAFSQTGGTLNIKSYVGDSNGSSSENKFDITSGTINLTGGTLNLNGQVNSSSFTAMSVAAGVTLNATTGHTTVIQSNNSTSNDEDMYINLNGKSLGNVSLNLVNHDLFLNSNLSIKGTLTLTDGLVRLGSNDLTIGINGGSDGAITGSSASYVAATLNGGTPGKLIRNVNNVNALYDFPIGDLTTYAPVRVDLNGGTTSLSNASIYAYTKPTKVTGMSSSADKVLNRSWIVEPSGITTPNYDIRYTYGSGEVIGDNTVDLVPIKFSVDTWYKPINSVFPDGTALGNATNINTLPSNTLEWTGLTSFSEFGGAGGNQPLPVELLSFNGTCNEGMVDLLWQTASEFNSSHFDVEKSTDGETWRVLATIPSAGTSNELLTYQTVDNNGTSGSNYYRLRQVDIDGKEKLYDPINVSCAETTAGYFTSYPNPSGSEFQVIVNNKEILGACTLNIVDVHGKVIDQRKIEVKDGINMFVISEKLNPGIYFLNITNGTKTTQVIKHAVK